MTQQATIHTPERLGNESMAAYRKRRAESRRRARMGRLITQRDRQHTNPRRNEQRRAVALFGAHQVRKAVKAERRADRAAA